MTALHAWLEGTYYGRFEGRDDGAGVTFTYVADAPDTPISLSLPRDGSATRNAAKNYLDNLLPDRPEVRQRMANHYGAADTTTFELLAVAGGDIAGGMVLLPDGVDPYQDVRTLDPALDRDVAERIAALKRDPDAWIPTGRQARFSLAGSQGKFALAKLDGDWYWSNRTLPSTHILKPAPPRLPGLEALEVDALTFAGSLGLPASRAALLYAEDQTSFLVERFDRRLTSDGPVRLHAEDFAQAAGIPTDRKYDQTAKRVIDVLRRVDRDDQLVYEWLRQLIFNTLIGNADAHAKNYTLLIRPGVVELSPLYDTVPVMMYASYSHQLAMDIAGARTSRAASLDHWRKLARTSRLDEDRVSAELTAIGDRMMDRMNDGWATVDGALRPRLVEQISRNIEASRRGSRGSAKRPH